MILSNTVKINFFVNDYEMVIDLMYQIAKGYKNNPNLRLFFNYLFLNLL